MCPLKHNIRSWCIAGVFLLQVMFIYPQDQFISPTSILSSDTAVCDSVRFVFSETTFGNLHISDYDCDGDHDILLASAFNQEAPTILIENNGDSYESADLSIVDVSGMGRGHAWGDIDNDNDPDLVVTGKMMNGLPISIIYRNVDGGGFVDIQASIEHLYESSAAFGDLDNDGDQDLVLSGIMTNGKLVTKIYLNIDKGLFAESHSYAGLSSGSVLIVDLDNDMDNDIIVNGFDHVRRPTTVWFRNENGNGFTELTGMIPGVAFGMWRCGDIDRNGLLDLIGIDGTTNQLIRAYQEPASTFSIYYIPLKNNKSCRLDISDIEGDGNIDVLLPSGAIIELSYTSATWFQYLIPGDSIKQDFVGDAAFMDWEQNDFFDLVVSSHEKKGTVLCSVASNNFPPLKPKNLRTEINGATTKLTWDPIIESPFNSANITYNLRVGTTPGGGEILSAMADTSGFHSIHDFGNCGSNNRWKLEDLSPGTYYWSVQAIDQGRRVSTFAEEDTFRIEADYRVIDINRSSIDTLKMLIPVDFDNDNDYDLLTITGVMNDHHNSASVLNVLENLGDYDFRTMDTIAWWSEDDITTISPCDLNNDGYIDFALATVGIDSTSEIKGSLVILRNKMGMGFVETVNDTTNVTIESIHCQDFDGDGDADILTIGLSSDTAEIILYTHLNTKPDELNFKSSWIRRLPGLSDIRSTISDFDRDGNHELIIWTDNRDHPEQNPIVQCFKILPHDILPDEQFTIPFITGGSETGDINNDGYMDLLEYGDTDELNYILQVYRNIAGKELVKTNPGIPGINSNGFAWLGDFNLDDRLDIYTLQEDLYSGLKELKVYKNDITHYSCNPVYIDRAQLLDSLSDNSIITVVDMDKDFDLDMVVSGIRDKGACTFILLHEIQTVPSITIPQPDGLMKTPTPHGMVLEWDHLADRHYSYNVRIGNSFHGTELLAPNSDPETGFLRFPHHGNAEYNNTIFFDSLPDGKYFWSVQGISNNKVGGPWSVVDSFVVGEITLDFNMTGHCTGTFVSFINLSNSQSSDYRWSFGDGATSAEQNPTYIYEEPGYYEVILRTLHEGSWYTRRKMIRIDRGIEVDFDYTKVETAANVPIWNITDTTGITPISWRWSFGDGEYYHGYDPGSHSYPYQAVFYATLFGQTAEGCADSVIKEVIVCKELLEVPEIYVRGPNVWYLACSNDSARFYRWYLNGERIQGADNPIYVAGGVMGEYYVEISKYGECYVPSETVTIPDYLLGNASYGSSNFFEVFPNPTDGIFILKINSFTDEPIEIEVFTGQGHVVYTDLLVGRSSYFSKEINIADQSSGLYLIRMRQGSYRGLRKLILH